MKTGFAPAPDSHFTHSPALKTDSPVLDQIIEKMEAISPFRSMDLVVL
jgi:hypothetical protein